MRKKIRKKIVTTLITLSLTMLVGCGQQQEIDITTAERLTPTETPIITEPPVITKPPTITEAPAITEAPTITETPVITKTPVTTEAPANTETPSITDPPVITHEHIYTESITLEATCTEAGEKTFSCECHDTYTKPIEAIGHQYTIVADSSVEATCTTDGKETDTICLNCGDLVSGAVIPAIGHHYEIVENSSVKATCTTDGKETDTKCSHCGNIITGAVIAATGHSYGEYIYNNDATQKADGTKSRTCNTCGKVDTKTAAGTKLPFDPYSLKAVTSLDEIPSLGTITNSDSSEYQQICTDIRAGNYEKIRYIASNGEQFCMWNVRVKDTRSQENGFSDVPDYYWFVAPLEEKFSDGYNASQLSQKSASAADDYLISLGMNISGSINESMLNRDESIPLGYRVINSTDCPVTLYEIVETDTMISVWVESTNCGQEGIGTCGTYDCTGTCLRSTTLDTALYNLPAQKGWTSYFSGENGRIQWNGKLLVNFYCLKH